MNKQKLHIKLTNLRIAFRAFRIALLEEDVELCNPYVNKIASLMARVDVQLSEVLEDHESETEQVEEVLT